MDPGSVCLGFVSIGILAYWIGYLMGAKKEKDRQVKLLGQALDDMIAQEQAAKDKIIRFPYWKRK